MTWSFWLTGMALSTSDFIQQSPLTFTPMLLFQKLKLEHH